MHEIYRESGLFLCDKNTECVKVSVSDLKYCWKVRLCWGHMINFKPSSSDSLLVHGLGGQDED